MYFIFYYLLGIPINNYYIYIIVITGSLLSAYFTYLENTMIFATLYDFLSLPLSGAYLSFM